MNANLQKKLRALTIIPESLYVRRAADEQLRGVVGNMGRPGYVLVARQMGKTNLLLNAKRELSNKDDVFLYVDLSNAFPTLQQFFRNIIDIAVETHPDHFALLQPELEKRRVVTNALPPHKEHEQELRALLNAIKGKIVICLDEVDALTKSTYSDNVFSLIRSTYFASRINFSEFNKLTYILSGVAEPTELIKNKDISPFNIGEKIYLDDFNYAEYSKFLEKADLSLCDLVKERVFYWTNGNPRMCWDLCSALEDVKMSGEMLNIAIVDKTVRRLYLTSYDIAPVDHIRQLVEDDKDIRNAIMSIHYKKYSSISDVQRTKLYLAGIVKADFLSDAVSIKNKVIEESLSEEWIGSIENFKLTIREKANKKFEERDFSSALALFLECDDGIIGSDKVYLYHNMGECCFRLGDYEAAIDYLTRAPARKSAFAMLFFRQQLWLGVAQFRLGDIEGSIERLNSVIHSDFAEGRTAEYFEALVNRCAAYFERFDEFGQAIIDDCTYVIEQAQDAMSGEAELKNTLVCAAYLNLATAFQKLGQNTDAVAVLREGVNAVDPISRPSLIVQLVDASPGDEHHELLISAARLIESERLAFVDDLMQEQINFSERIYAELLIRSLETRDISVWEQMLAPLVSGRFDDAAKKGVLTTGILLSIQLRKSGIVKSLLRAFLAHVAEPLAPIEFRSLAFYVLIVDDEVDVFDIEQKFVESFINSQVPELIERDILTMYVIFERSYTAERLGYARKVVNAVNSKRSELIKESVDPIIRQALIAIDFSELLLVAKKTDPTSELERLSRALRKNLPDVLLTPSSFPSRFFEQIRTEVSAILDVADSIVPEGKNKRRRNDIVICQFADGTTKKGKYKYFEQPLRDGQCRIVNEEKKLEGQRNIFELPR